MLKKVKINIFSLIIFITLTACQTVTDKIDQRTELEKKELSKWLNKTEEDLKSFSGQPDKVEFLKTRNRNYVYFTEKYKIKCERKFEVNPKNIVVGFSSKNCFWILAEQFSASKVNLFNFNKSFSLYFWDDFFTRNC